MAKKKSQSSQPSTRPKELQVGDLLTIEHTVLVPVANWPHPVKVIRGQVYAVREDGEGSPVDELSKTVWQKYAAKIQGLMAQHLRPASGRSEDEATASEES